MDKPLSGRDYFILPVLSFLTVVVLLGGAELAARMIWKKNINDPCLVHTSAGDRYTPWCTSKLKIPEGPWVTNQYNECGYRSKAPCSRKPPGTVRIAILGTSSAEGHMVVYELTYTALTEQLLSRSCHRPVEIQNLAVAGMLIFDAAARLDEAMNLEPDAVVFLLTPVDLWKDMDARDSTGRLNPAPPPPMEAADPTLRQRLQLWMTRARQSTALAMARYYLYHNPETYLQLYLQPGGVSTDFLCNPPTPPWREEYSRLDSLLGAMAQKANGRGIPIVVMASVFRSQVALLGSGKEFPSKDPYVFQREVDKIAEKYGIPFFNVLEDFRSIPRADQYFYMADGHMNAKGHRVLAQSLTRQLLENGILKRRGCETNSPVEKVAQR